MCKVYNTVGSLTTIRKHLTENKIESFNSINELISFQNNYASTRQKITENQKILITEERNNLSAGISQLEGEIEKNKLAIRKKVQADIDLLKKQYNELAEAKKSFIQEFTYSFKALFIALKIKYIQLFSNLIIYFAIKPSIKILTKKRDRLQYLVTHFEEVIKESSRKALNEIDHKKRAVDEINNFIYGAIGEQKVVKELEQLSDDYTLINDFSISFAKPIYNSGEKDYIKSIQIDHLLIAPSGIFLIETKNWSKDSIKNFSLRSPVDQIKRTNFALFRIVSSNSNSYLDQHHWGDRKIPIRNLIVLINQKPTEEFQYVKILTLNELLGYINYFKPSMSSEETQTLAKYLIKMNN